MLSEVSKELSIEEFVSPRNPLKNPLPGFTKTQSEPYCGPFPKVVFNAFTLSLTGTDPLVRKVAAKARYRENLFAQVMPCTLPSAINVIMQG
jgi:hypothetical protein